MTLSPAGRRLGRPPAKEPGSVLSVYVPLQLHDRLIALAQKQHVSVSSVARQLLAEKLDRR
jgi:predicted HicB family RNase H-like nuclease